MNGCSIPFYKESVSNSTTIDGGKFPKDAEICYRMADSVSRGLSQALGALVAQQEGGTG
jgi:hypothetical protein